MTVSPGESRARVCGWVPSAGQVSLSVSVGWGDTTFYATVHPLHLLQPPLSTLQPPATAVSPTADSSHFGGLPACSLPPPQALLTPHCRIPLPPPLPPPAPLHAPSNVGSPTALASHHSRCLPPPPCLHRTTYSIIARNCCLPGPLPQPRHLQRLPISLRYAPSPSTAANPDGGHPSNV